MKIRLIDDFRRNFLKIFHQKTQKYDWLTLYKYFKELNKKNLAIKASSLLPSLSSRKTNHKPGTFISEKTKTAYEMAFEKKHKKSSNFSITSILSIKAGPKVWQLFQKTMVRNEICLIELTQICCSTKCFITLRAPKNKIIEKETVVVFVGLAYRSSTPHVELL
jgi:hypothetical protein